MDVGNDSLIESMLCDSGYSGLRVVTKGFTRPDCKEDEYVMFVNAGGEASSGADSGIEILRDSFYEGGNDFRTTESITEAGDYPFIYHSARLGNFSYQFNNLPAGDFFLDLHFTEIINTDGPKGIRVFDIYIQEEKVVAEFDIFAIVGANKPLQLVDLRITVKENGLIVVRFEGINGSALVSGICIRRAPSLSVPEKKHDYLQCNNCAADVEVSPSKMKLIQTKSTAKFENKIQELTMQCQVKTKECYEAWMSLTAANEQLEKVRMELDNMTFKTLSQDQVMGKQAEDLSDISSKYERDKKSWAMAISDLQQKIKTMKEEQSQLSFEAHECADSIPELNKMVYAIEALVAQTEDLKLKYSEEQAKRKKLFNEVQEAKGNIRVFCRCRPLSKGELASGCTTIVDFDAAKDGFLGIIPSGSTKKSFKFDRVYTPKDNQDDVFLDASPMAISVLDGYNVCIFAYGQTGTGKTFTMEGTEQNRGVNYRTLEQLFQIASERRETNRYDISVSVLEVYNEQIRDLLATTPATKKLEIKQASEGSHHVPGIIEAKVDNIKDVWTVLQAGSNARAIGSNNVNEHSSRSHCLLCVSVRAKNLLNGECTKSKLWLVDLAGSERLAKTDVQGERLKEAQNINRSLSALGDVISALASKSSHIPFRNSKLTHLLQDSLGGDSKTLMFVQVSPSDQDLGETLSSLNFATRVRGIELGPAKKQIDTSELQKMKAMLEKVRQESRSKDEHVRKLEDNLQNVESKVKGKDQIYRSQQEKIKELEGQLELKVTLHNQLEKQVLQLSDRLKGKEEVCSSLQQKVKEIEIRVIEQRESESMIFEQKVRDLENRLKEQKQESDHYSAILQNKVEDLQRKLREQEQQASESTFLYQKIMELEEKLKEKEVQQLQAAATHDDFSDAIRAATPTITVKTSNRDDLLIESEARISRSSNSINFPLMTANQGSNLIKRNDSSSIHESRMKRQSRGGGETEKNISNGLPISLNVVKVRKSDPPKVSRLIRTVKPINSRAAAVPLTNNKRTSRDQTQLIMEREKKKLKIWSR